MAFTLAYSLEHQELIKHSRFIVRVSPAATLEVAHAFLEQRRQQMPDASHHCWAYRIDRQERFSDDGEPGGTAGRPMLEVLSKRDMNYVMAVVSRYFGGTKLGAGGLVRAYSGSLAKALDRAEIIEIKARLQLRLFVPFELMDTAHRLVDSIDELKHVDRRYSSEGLELDVDIVKADEDALVAQLSEVSQGRITCQHLIPEET